LDPEYIKKKTTLKKILDHEKKIKREDKKEMNWQKKLKRRNGEDTDSEDDNQPMEEKHVYDDEDDIIDDMDEEDEEKYKESDAIVITKDMLKNINSVEFAEDKEIEYLEKKLKIKKKVDKKENGEELKNFVEEKRRKKKLENDKLINSKKIVKKNIQNDDEEINSNEEDDEEINSNDEEINSEDEEINSNDENEKGGKLKYTSQLKNIDKIFDEFESGFDDDLEKDSDIESVEENFDEEIEEEEEEEEKEKKEEGNENEEEKEKEFIKPIKKSENYDEIKIKIRGQINKISIKNLLTITKEMHKIYYQSSKYEFNEILTTLMIESILSNSNFKQDFIINHASFCLCLNSIIDNSIGASIIEKFVLEFDKKYKLNDKMSCLNLLSFILYLYNLEVFLFE
jgi:hypothetical protein